MPCVRTCRSLEDDDVFIIPPAEWRRHDDFKAHSCWKAKTVWYGERHAAQAFQDFLQASLLDGRYSWEV